MTDLLQVADALAREKGVGRDEVLGAIEEAVVAAGRSRYGREREIDIRAHVDRRTGAIRLARYRLVSDDLDDDENSIRLADARRLRPGAVLGEYVAEDLPPPDFGRMATLGARQVLVQRVREAERNRLVRDFQDRVGEVVHGTVKRVERGDVIVDLGRAEAVLPRLEALPREAFKTGEPVRAIIQAVSPERRGTPVVLSRAAPEFLAALFRQEVPEVYDGEIVVKAVARDPGSRAKMAVLSRDGGLDPVGACIGPRGARVQAVVGELRGEKIDIIRWTGDTASMVVNALAPADVIKVVLDEDADRVEAVVPDDQVSLAIGRRGQNVRLAAQLLGLDIQVLGETAEAECREAHFRTVGGYFMETLDVDDTIAHLLVLEGFSTVAEIVATGVEGLAAIEAFEGIAEALHERALERLDAEHEARRLALGVADVVAALDGLTPAMLVRLGEGGVTTLDDLADLAADELRDLVGAEALAPDTANAVILAARARWFV